MKYLTISFAFLIACSSVATAGHCGRRVCYPTRTRTVYVKPAPKPVVQRVEPVTNNNDNRVDRSISVTYNIALQPPSAREGLTSYRAYAPALDPAEFLYAASQYSQIQADNAAAFTSAANSIISTQLRLQNDLVAREQQIEFMRTFQSLLQSTGSPIAGQSFNLSLQQRPDGTMTGQVNGQPVAGAQTGLQVIQNRCLRCHTSDAPRGGLVLSDLSKLNEVQRARIADAVTTGIKKPDGTVVKMPYNDEGQHVPIPGSEVGAILRLLYTGK